ncbi:MAG TPA: VOC family protein [Longimicrobium sp.]|jgi:predicted enzyme related to lactoylglutathione lyase
MSTGAAVGALPARVGTVPVFVNDQARALDFWRDSVGWEPTIDIPIGNGNRWLAVAPPGGGTELLLYVPGMYGEVATTLMDRVGMWTGMVLLTDDIHGAYQAMVARGVPFGGEPEEQPWGGWETWFADPDGNRFQLAQRPEGMGG